MNAQEWVAAYAAELGVDPPTTEEFEAILELAAVGAHSSERVAAPVACWLSARSGRPLDESIAIAQRVAGTPEA